MGSAGQDQELQRQGTTGRGHAVSCLLFCCVGSVQDMLNMKPYMADFELCKAS